ncbi:MAG: RloB domain-containing protein [Bacteroidales bacterium]|nr:RloB domain-containing protein [Bacteroidales bacterium]
MIKPRQEDIKTSHYTLRIVCEGTKTEPLFFTDLCKIFVASHPNTDAGTVPKARLTEDEEDEAEKAVQPKKRGRYNGKKLTTKPGKKKMADDEPVMKGAPPLNWVNYGHSLLDGGVDEVWVVYDKDEHPMHEAAAKKIKELQDDNKNIEAAFSSRSIEHYYLLHFEYNTTAFPETECGERIHGNKHSYRCGTYEHPKDCHGKHCINGYARTKGYWEESKKDISMYQIVKDHILMGIYNALKLEAATKAANPGADFYTFNPYTTAHRLVARLLDIEIPTKGEMSTQHSPHQFIVGMGANGIKVCNTGKNRQIFPANSFRSFDPATGARTVLQSPSRIIEAGETTEIPVEISHAQMVIYEPCAEWKVVFVKNC